MTSRSDCEPLPKPTLSPSFALARPGTFLRVGFFHCRSVVCACSAGTVGSFSNTVNHFRQKKTQPPSHPPQRPSPPLSPSVAVPPSAAVWSMPLSVGYCGFSQ